MAERLVIIDYGSGNLRSAAKALQRAADDADVSIALKISGSRDDVLQADRIVLPGVGAFNQCVTALRAVDGLEEALQSAVIHHAKPFLGICVGMQLMARVGEEHGIHQGLGWIDGVVAKIEPHDPALKIPHMGWNVITKTGPGQNHPVLTCLPDGARTYFVHSYAMTGKGAWQLATTDYAGTLPAIVGRDTMIGTQFHPEKSQGAGLAFLTEFLKWKP
jgi:imidazole glycerol-phosphate synthase subunit HisH